MSITQRDELAAVIVSAYGEDADELCPCEQDFQVAEAILAAGYRKPRTITTVEELGSLFEGAYGTDADGLLWTIEDSGFAWINIAEGSGEKYRDSDIKLPFTLLSPEAEVVA